MSKVVLLLLVLVCAFSVFGQTVKAPEITEGSLFAASKDGKTIGMCPLKNTSVKTDISGFMARVRVRQEFENSYSEPIEAVYTFPLSQTAAVDNMTMIVGTRRIRGTVLKRQDAREVYEQAKTAGKTASLLDQQRPNIFTQQVANIMPGEKLVVEISYVETLKYEDGAYEFVFPMTVGPRYKPASVTDAANITTTYTLAERSGHDISIEVNLNAGVPVEEIRSTSHDIQQTNFAPNRAQVVLKNGTTIPNKDFILRYDVTGGKIQDAVLTHRGERGGFFTMILQPPDRIAPEDRTPKEIVFVLDTSGSMYGFPIDKAKEAMKLSLEGLYPDDTFNLITFAGETKVLFDAPVPATQANMTKALAFLETQQGGGGTEMMKAIKTALDPSDANDHLRIVCFMTDGYVGNEEEIIAEIQRHPRARVFSFGIGNSVNRFLLDKMAEAGKGEVEYVALTDDGSKAAKRFYERVRSPLLTDLSLEWNGLPVSDVYPGKLTDLFSAKPVIVYGRYTKAAAGKLTLRGKIAGQEYSREIGVNFPEAESANDSLATLWARKRIDDLSNEKLKATSPAKSLEFENLIANVGLEFQLMTNFTSFVAVEDRVVNQDGKPVTVQVPASLPDGVDPVMSGATVDVVASAEINQATSTAGSNVSTEFFSNVPTSRTVQGLYTISPGVSRSGLRDASGRDRDPSVAGSSGPENSYILDGATTTSPAFGGGGGGRQEKGETSQGDLADQSRTPKHIKPKNDNFELKQPIATTEGDRKSSKGSAGYSDPSSKCGGLSNGTGSGGGQGSGYGTGQASLTTVQMSNTVSAQQILSLPLNGRNPLDLENTFVLDGVESDGGHRMGRAVVIVRPNYPDSANAAKTTGEVEVVIETDTDGNVLTAKAVSGPESLLATSEAAAKLSRFEQQIQAGQPVRLCGTIMYKFTGEDNVGVFLRNMKLVPATDDDKRLVRVKDVMHFWLYDVIARLNSGSSTATTNESKFVRDGSANIRIELTGNIVAARDQLRSAGVEIESVTGSIVKGRIPLEKLKSLAKISQVMYVAPRL